MIWKGKELKTYGDLMDDGILKCETKEEALKFRELYREETEHADKNIGYLSGYCGKEEMERIQELFEVAHPIFGNSNLTPEEAFELGKLVDKDD